MNGIVIVRQAQSCWVAPRAEVRHVERASMGDVRVVLASGINLYLPVGEDDATAKEMINDLTDPSMVWEMPNGDKEPMTMIWRHDGTSWQRTQGRT